MMSKRKANQNISKIIEDLAEGRYRLRKVPEEERNPSRLRRIKKLFKKLRKAIGEKNDRLCARRVYKSFEKSYPWIPIRKNWKMRYFSRLSVQDAEEIARKWISTELNPVEGENM